MVNSDWARRKLGLKEEHLAALRDGCEAFLEADLGLHISDMISLFHMQPDEGVSQRALAEHWACDPSWVTNRIDRLEQLGLVERRLSPTDRRVKEVWLTPAGEKTRTHGMDGFAQPPASLGDLSLTDLRNLAKALGKLDLPDPTKVGAHGPTAD